MLTTKKAIFTGLFVLLSTLFYLLSHSGLGKFDSIGNEYFENSLKKAAITYATVRGVNSLVSVVKESKMEVAPAGVGVSIAVGEVLDPLDDMTERVSSVLVMAIVALGTQKIFFEIINDGGFLTLCALSLLIALMPYLSSRLRSKTYQFLLKLFVLVLILRLLLPVSALISTYFHDTIFQEKIETSKLVLSNIKGSSHFDMEIEKSGNFLEKIKSGYLGVEKRFEDVKSIFNHLQSNMGEIISALISLVTVYIFLFLVDVIILPVGIFLLIYKGLKVYF